MAGQAYTVKLEAFEGPLDLLLHLVRTHELDIYNLPIATITDQYLAYLEMFEELNLDVAGEYLVMAASLMYMKSRLLLPVDEEAEEPEEDPVQDLVRQLADYQRYSEAAENLRDRAILNRDVFRRDPSPVKVTETERPPVHAAELADLFEGLRRVLEAAAARQPHTLEGEEFSVADCVKATISKLKAGGRTKFEDLFIDHRERGRIIATFIGLLELMKMGVIEAEQEGVGEPIWILLVGEDVDERVIDLMHTYTSAVHETGSLELQGEGP